MRSSQSLPRLFFSAAGLSAAALLQSPLRAQPRVQVNGQVLRTSVPAMQSGGRVLVPMRAIFQALGAPVSYNKLTQEVTAQSGAANVRLRIGQRKALVNGQSVTLEQAPILYRGATLVPLRFVAEGLGADVHWNNALQLVSVSTKGTAGQPGRSSGGQRTIVIPADSVVPVRLNATISSGDARVGDIFTARVQSSREGDSEFPPGSSIEGVVTGVSRQRAGSPGVLSIEFRNVVLPDGARFPIRGQVIPLDDESVRTNAQGRVVARPAVTRGGNLKVIGIGAGTGYVLGRLQRRNGVITNVSRATGAMLYNRLREAQSRFAEAVVPQGTALGVRLTNGVSYADTTNYSFGRGQFLNGQSNPQ